MTDDIRTNAFTSWMEEMEDVLGKPVNSDTAARLLGKSVRMIRYYEEGRDIPEDTRLLMAALAEGYKPKPWPKQ